MVYVKAVRVSKYAVRLGGSNSSVAEDPGTLCSYDVSTGGRSSWSAWPWSWRRYYSSERQ